MQASERDADIKNRLLDCVGELEGGMIWENSIETCILQYVKEMTSTSSTHETGHWKLVHWDNPRDGGHMYTHGWFMSMYAKTTTNYKVISLQLK